MVTLAATTVNAWLAGGMMIAFGLGTAPVMIATALGGAYLGLRWRNRLFTIAGYWVVLLGLWTLAGGVEQLAHGSPLGPVSCPFCR
jgi:sulfite exporter TauE/SafE